MRLQITCDGITDGHDLFKIITFRPPIVAIKDELKELFKKRQLPCPYMKFIQRDTETIRAYYRFKEDGDDRAEKVVLTFELKYV